MSPEILTLVIMNSKLPDGVKTLVVRLIERDRNFRVVLSVAEHHRNGKALTDEEGSAYDATANEFHLSSSSIRKIYSKHKSILENLV